MLILTIIRKAENTTEDTVIFNQDSRPFAERVVQRFKTADVNGIFSFDLKEVQQLLSIEELVEYIGRESEQETETESTGDR